MRGKGIGRLAWVVLLLSMIVTVYGEIPFTPRLRPDNSHWHIGYYEGGNYRDYSQYLEGLISGLIELGWIDSLAESPPEELTSLETWRWYSDHITSDYLELMPDACWSANWDESIRAVCRSEILERFRKKRDIDLMLALGTWAGQDLATNEHDTNTFVLSASDPIQAGIIKGSRNSGFTHIMAVCDPYRFRMQLRLFHDIFMFRKLGVVYEDTPAGRSYAGIAHVDSIARERGFDVVYCAAVIDTDRLDHRRRDVLKCHQWLIEQGVDAVYITEGSIEPLDHLQVLIQPFIDNHIPTFSQSGPEEVRRGVAISFAVEDREFTGIFTARNIGRVFNGALPGELNQVCRVPPRLTINMAAAQQIGWYVPIDILKMADEVFLEIEK